MKHILIALLIIFITVPCAGQTFNLFDTAFALGAIYRPNIHFHFDRAEIFPESHVQPDSISAFLKKHSSFKMEVGVHEDSIAFKSRQACCKILPILRGKRVVDYLVSTGIAPDRLAVKSYLCDVPLFDEIKATGEPRRETRSWLSNRVEFKLLQFD